MTRCWPEDSGSLRRRRRKHELYLLVADQIVIRIWVLYR